VVVEHILSGDNDAPHRYLQEQDEWVTLVTGSAVVDVGGERMELGPGDWAFLPSGVPHTVERTQAGTTWLAVHVYPVGAAAPTLTP
jgi:cupin 2 domain-containing protein